MLQHCLWQSLTVQTIKNQLEPAPSNRRKQCSHRLLILSLPCKRSRTLKPGSLLCGNVSAHDRGSC